MKGGDFEGARRLFGQADKLADEGVRQDIDALVERTNAAEAQALAEDLVVLANKGKCQKAAVGVAEVVRARAELAAGMREAMSKSLGKCADRLVGKDDLAAARALVWGDEAALAMNDRALKAAKKRVLDAISAAIDEKVGKHLEARRFEEALAAAAELEKEGVVSAAEKKKVLALARENIVAAAAELAGKPQDELEGDELERLDAWLVLGWAEASERPEELLNLRREVAFAAVCASLRCEASSIEKRWLFGHATPRPHLDPKGAPVAEQLKSGALVWAIAKGGGYVLVATEKPGELEGVRGRAHVGVGWVSETNLRDTDTSELLPPGESLLGLRVWALLRKGEKLLELGTVSELRGANVLVRRLSDRAEVELPRAKLSFGVAKPGTKVLGFCAKADALEPALIESVKESAHDQTGDPVAKLRCLDAAGAPTETVKEAQLGSLRMRPEWLSR